MIEPSKQLTFLHEFQDTDEKLELIESENKKKTLKVITEESGG